MALRAPVLASLHRTFAARERAARHRARTRVRRSYVAREDPQLTQFATFMAIAEREGPGRARRGRSALRDPRSAGGGARCASELARARRLPPLAAVRARPAARRRGAPMRARPGWRSGSIRISPSARRRRAATCGRTPASSCRARRSVRRPTCTRTRDRTGDCRRSIRTCCARRATTTGSGCCAPASGTPARCASITCSDCSGCSGFRSASRRASGAYVRRSRDDLFGILALESVRHGCARRRRGSRHRAAGGAAGAGEAGACSAPRCSSSSATSTAGGSGRRIEYPRLALATVNTHDLPPLVGWLRAARHRSLRSEVGDLTDPEQQRGDARRAHARPRRR